MTILIVGIVLFFSLHTLPMLPSARSSLNSKVGPKAYKIAFSLLAITGFIAIIIGMKKAPFLPLWTPPTWAALVAGLTMPVAFTLLVAAHVPNNFTAVIRNPMLTATLLWALAHLLGNGDAASALLFGSFALFAVVDIASIRHRKEKEAHVRRPLMNDFVVVAAGLATFWLVRYFHGEIFGVPVTY